MTSTALSELTSESCKIAVVNSSSFGRTCPDLMERLEELGSVRRVDVPSNISGRDLARELAGHHFIIASVTPQFPESFFRGQKDALLIARHGIGCDNVDLPAATDHGVIVTRVTHEDERDAVAELSLSLIMTCIRQIIPASDAVQERRWDKRATYVGKELSHMTVGIVGYGNIGSRVGEIVSEGFGAEVLACDPNIADAVLRKTGVRPATLDQVLREADLISFNASLNPDNYHFIGEDEFALMKDGVIIVNTARGELIDTGELVNALHEGKIASVGLDVAETEPIEDDNPLLDFPNVHIVPHIGSYTERSIRKMDEKMVVDVETVLDSRIPHAVVNSAVLRSENRSGIQQ
ncbi:MAG: D-isomer specific 2-hydroxyacid dehydrogenase family protein [Candidatus Brocadiia bacterium]